MMDNLRTASNSTGLKIILLLIILSLLITSINSYLSAKPSNFVAQINGKEISYDQLEGALKNELINQKQILGTKLSKIINNESYINTIRQHVLYELINEELLAQYAKKIGLRISDNQIKDEIINNPKFKKNNQFNNYLYINVLNKVGFTAKHYAETLRRHLTIQQLIKSITETDFLLQNEVHSLKTLLSQQRLVRIATIYVDKLFSKQTITPKEIINYYENNKIDFIVPEQFRVSYIELTPKHLYQKLVNDRDVRNWYNQHKQEYIQPSLYHYSIIQTKKEREAKLLLKKLKHGADFAILAKEKSTDPISAPQGGKLGWFDSINMPDELKNLNLKKKGELSDVINSSIGFIIARLNDIQPGKVKSFSEVKLKIIEKLKQEKAIDDYYNLVNKISNYALNERLVNIEKKIGIKAIKTDWFSLNNIPTKLKLKEIEDILFQNEQVSDKKRTQHNFNVINIDGEDRTFILYINEYKEKVFKSLEAVKLQIIDILKRKKAKKEVKVLANKILVALKEGKGNNLMQELGVSFNSQYTVTRNDIAPIQDKLKKTIFSLPLPTNTNPSYGISEDKTGNLIIISLDKVQNNFLNKVNDYEIVNIIMQNNTQSFFTSLLRKLRKESTIKYGLKI